MERFYFENIELLNYRRFSNRIFELNPNMNIVIGKNASGKTTVLEAATVAMGHTSLHLKNMFQVNGRKIFLKQMF